MWLNEYRAQASGACTCLPEISNQQSKATGRAGSTIEARQARALKEFLVKYLL